MPYKYKISEIKNPVELAKRREKNRLKQKLWTLKYPEKAKMKRVKWREKYDLLVSKYKKVCVNCGYSNPIALEFHHVNPKEKLFTIGTSANIRLGMDKMEKEIQKCIVLCSNCHRLEEVKKYNWQ